MSAIRSRSSRMREKRGEEDLLQRCRRCARTAAGSRSWPACTRRVRLRRAPGRSRGAEASDRLPEHVLERRHSRRIRPGGARWLSRSERRPPRASAPRAATVEIAASASSWPTIAQAPYPSSAIVIPVTAPTSVAAICRSSSRRNCMSRTSSAICVVPSALTRKPRENDDEQRLHLRLAVEVRERACEPRCPPSASGSPTPALTQKTVDRSSSLQLAPLDQRRAEGVVGEDDDEAREDERPSPRDPSRPASSRRASDSATTIARDLQRHLRCRLPGDAAQDARADRVARRRALRS